MQRKGLKMRLYYGLINENQIEELTILVCNCLGYGKNNSADKLIMETIASETQYGTYEDKTKYVAQGLCQFDKMPFEDVVNRTSKKNKIKLYDCFGIHLSFISWEDLRYNPLLSIIMCRLKYLLIREEIPPDRESRYDYYKKWYNSYDGKATKKHYMESCEKFLKTV